MAEFYALLARSQGDMARAFFNLTQAASDALTEETRATVKIQSAFRGSVVRARFHAVLRACAMLARVIRGKMGRTRAAAKELERARRWNHLFFHHCAEVVQKFFRGYWSRKYLHDFYARRSYLSTVAARGERTRDFLDQAHARQLSTVKITEEQHTRKEFDDLCAQLHHLVSTHQIPGVYNPPYSDVLPRAFEKPIEIHLRDSCRVRLPPSLRRPNLKNAYPSETNPAKSTGAGTLHKSYGGMTRMEVENGEARPPQIPAEITRKPLLSRTANVGRLQAMQGPFRSKELIEVKNSKAHNLYRSLQAAEFYGFVEDERRMHERLAKLTRVSPDDFTVKKPCPDVQVPGVNAETKYLDRPVEFRSEYLELPKIKDKPPFFTAMPHDKNFTEYDEKPLLSHGAV